MTDTSDLNTTENSNSETPKTRWGFFSTLGLGLIATFVFVITQALAGIALALYYKIPLDKMETMVDLLGAGFITEVTFPAGAILSILTVILFIKLRKGFSIKEYLCLNVPTSKTLLTWVAVLVLIILVEDVTTYLLGKEVVPQTMIDTYNSSRYGFLMLLCVLLLAPISEEVIFRGFMLMGMKPKEGCPVWIIMFVSLLWAMLHIQYDIYYMAIVFISGILFGVAQVRTNSIIVPITLHFVGNLIATVELLVTVYYLN